MFTSVDKAIAGLVAPIISLLVMFGLMPEDLATESVIGAVTALVTTLAVWIVPNKES